MEQEWKQLTKSSYFLSAEICNLFSDYFQLDPEIITCGAKKFLNSCAVDVHGISGELDRLFHVDHRQPRDKKRTALWPDVDLDFARRIRHVWTEHACWLFYQLISLTGSYVSSTFRESKIMPKLKNSTTILNTQHLLILYTQYKTFDWLTVK